MPHRSTEPRTAAGRDQAAGLRRMFARAAPCFLPLVANPHLGGFGSVVLERVTTAFAQAGIPVLLLDAAATSPEPSDLAVLDLAGCVERLDEHTYYLAGRGLPRSFVDSRGSAQRLLGALMHSVPTAQAIVVHADAADLVRCFHDGAVRPLLMCGESVESVKHAYAAGKLLAQRGRLLSFDLLMCAAPSRHARAASKSLGDCLEGFLGATLMHAAQVDPASDVTEPPAADLRRLLNEQLQASARAQHDVTSHQGIHPMQHGHAWQTTTT